MKSFAEKWRQCGCLLAFLVLTGASPVLGWDSKGVKEARGFIEVGRTDRAIEILQNWTNQNAKDLDAYWLLATLYMDKGYYNQAEEQFNYAVNLDRTKHSEVMERFKKAFIHELTMGNPREASLLAQKLVGFEPGYKQQAYQELYKSGKKFAGEKAIAYYRSALPFATTQEEREKIGKMYLLIAITGGPIMPPPEWWAQNENSGKLKYPHQIAMIF